MVTTGLSTLRLAARAGALVVVAFTLSLPAQTSAQDLTLRPSADLHALAQNVAIVLSRRTGDNVVVGQSPPTILDAVPRGHVGMRPAEGMIELVLGAARGRSLHSSLARAGDPSALARSLALAIESLQDEAAALPPPREESDDVLFIEGPEAPTEVPPIAKPTLYLRMLFGVSPIRKTLIIGPGAGLGLCVHAHCVVLEADLSLIPQYETSQRGERYRYRPVNVAVRGILRPFENERFSFGLGIGLLTRVGKALIVGTDRAQVVTNLGFRGSVELAVRVRGPFEWVFDAGVDIAVSRAAFSRYGDTVFLEDQYTPWIVTSLRVRPGR